MSGRGGRRVRIRSYWEDAWPHMEGASDWARAASKVGLDYTEATTARNREHAEQRRTGKARSRDEQLLEAREEYFKRHPRKQE